MTYTFNTMDELYDGWVTISENTQVGDWFVVSVDDIDETCLYRRETENEFSGYEPKQKVEFTVLSTPDGSYHSVMS